MGHEVVLYSRPGCHLCDDARTILARVRAQRPFAFTERDIEQDEELLRAYLERIPVVTIDDDVTLELFVDEAVLMAALSD
jgi:glutaredoxin